MPSISEAIAEKIATFPARPLDSATALAARRLTLDTIGVALAGAATSEGRSAMAYSDNAASTKLFGQLLSAKDPRTIVFAPSLCAHVLDFDDMYRPGGVHLGCVIVPVCLVLAARSHANLRQFLSAVTVGAEMSACVAEAVHDSHHRLGFHLTATANAFGAAACAAVLQGLNPAAIASALGLAGDQAAGLRQYHFDRASTKPLHAAYAARLGIDAALLATANFQGPARIFEGKFGFCTAYTNGRYDAGPLVSFLDAEARIRRTSYKPWPCGRGTHAAVQATLKLHETSGGIVPSQVERVQVLTYERAFINLNKPNAVGHQRRLSIQYCVARAISDGQVDLHSFDGTRLHHPEFKRLLDAIEVLEAPTLTNTFANEQSSNPTIVHIHLRDGTVLTQEVQHSLGSPELPLSDADLNSKFLRNTSDRLGVEGAHRLLNLLTSLEPSDEPIQSLCQTLSTH